MASGRNPAGRSAASQIPRALAVRLRRAAVVLAVSVTVPVAAPAKDLKAVDRMPTVTFEAAALAAQAALAECRKRGATVAVAVVDRSGIPLVMMRDPLAGMHTPETAIRKAWTAVSFRGSTSDLVGTTAPGGPNGGIRHLPNVAMVGGGLLLRSAGSVVGGIGVSGAPGGDLDDACAEAGIRAITEALELG